MLSGVLSYLAAPIWLALLVMGSTEAVAAPGLLPLALVALLLLTPKICGLIAASAAP